jgi:hypothetical protein
MIRKFCDRCGVECERLIDIKIPFEIHGNGSFCTKEITVCDTCNKIHENINKTLTEIRFSMYANLFYKGRADDGT